ncbi:hypothetical protein E2C01_024898 [Portunus trituberculatus]|uniref:CSD domain-containing protein n=1 Tax=Portunus trituberculatus TaxID=210409 RepID=A0A5B7EGF3_PORTR|nr:hypothetical protein [Portunus trituberculatus]
MASPVDHPGLVKWYNVKAGCGFIQDLRTGKDVFCHASGLTRSLKDRPPREGDQALAGSDHRHLQELLPTILQHNGLPAIKAPLSALTTPNPSNRSRSRRDQPGTEAAPNQQAATAAEPEPTGDKPRNRKETQDDVPGEEDDDEEEDEEVDVLGSGSEGEGPSPQASKPNFPSDPQPPSGKQEEDDGWVTKTKRRRRPSPNTLSAAEGGRAGESAREAEEMGGQQGKERHLTSGTITRSSKAKYRSGRDIRTAGANIFTEHNGEYPGPSTPRWGVAGGGGAG